MTDLLFLIQMENNHKNPETSATEDASPQDFEEILKHLKEHSNFLSSEYKVYFVCFILLVTR